ncbi:DNA topoisomerase I [Reticulomyxa filosa]|uniref:DNA topoisomerase I n=1 Tax=Reticulomyxa filosa TaxID=46433 RepID=X6N1B3_RETFI|nr:DNA topoisomerase I [Reticulomyxa filosa]|eukprot:ETO19841.1 DNA topoisomerase I [Reticulomyxa filosa]
MAEIKSSQSFVNNIRNLSRKTGNLFHKTKKDPSSSSVTTASDEPNCKLAVKSTSTDCNGNNKPSPVLSFPVVEVKAMSALNLDKSDKVVSTNKTISNSNSNDSSNSSSNNNGTNSNNETSQTNVKPLKLKQPEKIKSKEENVSQSQAADADDDNSPVVSLEIDTETTTPVQIEVASPASCDSKPNNPTTAERRRREEEEGERGDGENSEYKPGDMVLLRDQREGLIRYVGPVHFSVESNADKERPSSSTESSRPFDKVILYGIELLGTSVGTHDGNYLGLRYFRTASERGTFVKGSQIWRKMTASDFAMPPGLQEEIEKIRKERKNNKAQDKKKTQPKVVPLDVNIFVRFVYSYMTFLY